MIIFQFQFHYEAAKPKQPPLLTPSWAGTATATAKTLIPCRKLLLRNEEKNQYFSRRFSALVLLLLFQQHKWIFIHLFLAPLRICSFFFIYIQQMKKQQQQLKKKWNFSILFFSGQISTWVQWHLANKSSLAQFYFPINLFSNSENNNNNKQKQQNCANSKPKNSQRHTAAIEATVLFAATPAGRPVEFVTYCCCCCC